MAKHDPPSERALELLHYLQDEANYGRTYPATISDTARLIWFFIKRLRGMRAEWPLPLLEGFAGGTQLLDAVAGVTTISKLGSPLLSGGVTLSEGANITLTQVGQNIQIAGTAAGALGGCSVFRTTATANITSGVIFPVPFDNEEFDDSGYHDNATNPSRFTISVTGVYMIASQLTWDVNATGSRGLFIIRNGVDDATNRLAGDFRAGLTGSDSMTTSIICTLAAGAYVETYAFQTSGANRTVVATSSRPRMSIYRLA